MSLATFSQQHALPRLPIPPLAETLKRYLLSVKAIATESEFAQTSAAVEKFQTEGAELQRRLQAHDATKPTSWLSDWWLQLAYHSWRESVLINSNWYMILTDTNPLETAKVQNLYKQGPVVDFTETQVNRAAHLIAGSLEYKDLIDSERLPAEFTKAGPLCMNQYRNLFGVTRVPFKDCDYNVGQQEHPCHSKHIVVLIRDQFYAMQVYVEGKRLNQESIAKELWKVINDVRSGNKSVNPPIGILTGEHRDTWAAAHVHLKNLSPQNSATLRVIETAIFNVSLDEYVVGPSLDSLSQYTFHNFDGKNRWFDKSISLCISADGRAGVNGEHSPLDALVAAYAYEYANSFKEYKPTTDAMKSVGPVKKLDWVVDANVKQDIAKAQVFVKALIADSDQKLFQYSKYGADFIKKQVGVSPDAFMQMALQLTFFRMHNHFPAVYETASTRKYLFGRTETGRSMSVASASFIKIFQDSKASAEKKMLALKEACKSHIEYMVAAGNGHGCDRHLLGLRVVAKPGETFDIFKDPMYARSQHYDLSTSALFPAKYVEGTGFGAVYPDGYGMNYILHPKYIRMGLESKVSVKKTSTAKYCETLTKVLDDLYQLGLSNSPPAQAKI